MSHPRWRGGGGPMGTGSKYQRLSRDTQEMESLAKLSQVRATLLQQELPPASAHAAGNLGSSQKVAPE